MPVYIFRCPVCLEEVELIQPFSAPPPNCIRCRDDVQRTDVQRTVKQWATTGPIFRAVRTRSYRSPQGFKITTQDQD